MTTQQHMERGNRAHLTIRTYAGRADCLVLDLALRLPLPLTYDNLLSYSSAHSWQYRVKERHIREALSRAIATGVLRPVAGRGVKGDPKVYALYDPSGRPVPTAGGGR